MALSAGTRLGPYEILESLGAGGMGEVYRAHDTKLDRDVALKVLPEGALTDHEARKRFRREANALSRLSHPHVATLFDFDTAHGTDFLVMELVRGPSLKDELEEKGALPERDVVRLGAQLARGLQAAHEQGIVHRDLKPGNLQLTPDGLLKILDFGLARLLPQETAPGEETAPTQTAVGRVAGTLLYMSPEQLRGRGVDARTDLYAAGAVLYEMATGRRLFSKPSSAELTEAILGEDPIPPRDLNERISPGLEAVIQKALDKDPELRYQTAKELLVDLERLQVRPDSRSSGSGPGQKATEESHGEPIAVSLRTSRARSRRWLGALLLVVVAAIVVWLARPTELPRITAVHPLLPRASDWVATDGTRVYQIFMRKDGRSVLQHVAISGGNPVETPIPLPGVVRLLGTIPGESALLIASHGKPDGEDTLAEWPVWRLPLPDGVPERLGGLRASYADASPDGRSLALVRGGVLTVASMDGSNTRELLQSEYPLGRVRWSPDGRRLRYESPHPEGDRTPLWIWEVPATGGTPRPLWAGHQGGWTGDGRYFIFDQPPTHDLVVVREHPWTRLWSGTPRRLTAGLGNYGFNGSSREGDRLLVTFYGQTPPGAGTLLRYDADKKGFEPALGGESALWAEPSPDGEWIAWVRYPEGTLWRSRPDGSERLQLTRPPGVGYLPRWSPDGKRLVFISQPDPSALTEIRVVAADGSESELLVRPEPPEGGYWDACFLPDESIVFSHRARDGLFRYDPETRRIGLVPGAEHLRYPKCSREGDVWAYPGQLRRWGDREWRDLGASVGGWPSWTRDGRSVCGITLLAFQAEAIRCLDVEAGRMTFVAGAWGMALSSGGQADTPWMGLDAQDRPLVMLSSSEQASSVRVLQWETP